MALKTFSTQGISIAPISTDIHTARTFSQLGIHPPLTIEYVVVGGGGGGGGTNGTGAPGAGGGAGGFVTSSSFVVTAGSTYAITVGAGGNAGAASTIGSRGQYSLLSIPTDATYSGSFNGTSQYLSIASNALLAFGTGNFTVECWMYSNNISASQEVFDLRTPDTANAGFDLTLSASTIRFGTNGTFYITGTTTLLSNTWYHIAISRSGTTTYQLFLNGIQEGSTYTTSQNFTNNTLRIGNGVNGFFNGYISNLRVVKGTGLYTTNFVPPRSPLAVVSGTSLLTLQDATFIDKSSNNIAIVSTATITSVITPTSGIFALGGGGGGALTAGAGGASGGGGGYGTTGGVGIAGQGNTGGIGAPNGTNAGWGGGGGGAGAVGQAGGSGGGGAAGTGTFTTLISTATAISLSIGQYITATNVIYFSGGGSSGGHTGGTGALGGWGGGGGSGAPGAAATAGRSNTGGGGGGAGTTNVGAAGGSGVVIIRQPSNHTRAVVVGGETTTTSAGYIVYAWKTSGSITF